MWHACQIKLNTAIKSNTLHWRHTTQDIVCHDALLDCSFRLKLHRRQTAQHWACGLGNTEPTQVAVSVYVYCGWSVAGLNALPDPCLHHEGLQRSQHISDLTCVICVWGSTFYIIQGCHIWLKSGSNWPQMWQIQFRRAEPICTEIFFWKNPGFIPFGSHLTHFRPKSGNSMPAWLLSLTNVSTLHYNKMTGLRNDCVSVLSSATTHCTPRWQSSIASYRARQEK